jgi:hypothetical protein
MADTATTVDWGKIITKAQNAYDEGAALSG